VSVTIYPATDRSRLMAYIDDPEPSASVRGSFRVAGWAGDSIAWTGSGIGAVHVWAQRRAPFEAPVFLGPAQLGGGRPDVAAAVGAQFDRSGWSVTAAPLPPGTYDITAYFWSVRTARFEDARTVTVTAK
jgi:hypothetical protein